MTPILAEKLGLRSAARFAVVLCSAVTMMAQSVQAQLAEPPQSKQISLVRQAGASLTLQGELSRNNYRKEAYQDKYIEKVPYQAEETYYESVPYQVDVPYQDTEEYYENEYVCHERTRYENECNYENRCRSVDNWENVCEDRQICTPRPGRCREVEECGTNARGERICKTRRVCDNDSPDCRNERSCRQVNHPRQECHQERICRDVPRRHNECGYESVRKTRQVTRHRTETRYRQEERTRTVTRYRDEERCCVTKYRDVFVSQDKLAVEVVIPAQATLEQGEVEAILVRLNELGGALSADLDLSRAVYSYKIADKQETVGRVRFVLEIVASQSAAELGAATIKGVELQIAGNGAKVTLTDSGLKNKVTTTYNVVVKDKATQSVVMTAEAKAGKSEKIQIPLSGSLQASGDYEVDVLVRRTGIMLDQDVEFVAEGSYLGRVNPQDFIGEKLITDIAITNRRRNAFLSFKDLAPQASGVVTYYRIVMQTPSGWNGRSWKTFADKIIPQSQMRFDAATGTLAISPVQDMGVSPTGADSHFNNDHGVLILMTVVRQSQRFGPQTEYRFDKKKQLYLP